MRVALGFGLALGVYGGVGCDYSDPVRLLYLLFFITEVEKVSEPGNLVPRNFGDIHFL